MQSDHNSVRSKSEKTSHDLRRYLNIRSVASPKFSPDGKNIAFLSNLTGVSQVWMTGTEGSNGSMQLLSVDDEERAVFVQCSKTSDLLAYGIDLGGNERYQINVLENKGETLRRITNNPKVIHSFGSFSPDARKLSYSSNLRNQTFFDVYIQDTEGEPNSGELVYQSDESNFVGEWSPGGDKLLFKTVYAPFNEELFLLDLSSRDAEPVFNHKGAAVFDSVAFSKDGKWICCVSNVEREFNGLARIDANNHTMEFVHSEDSSDVEQLEQSPDGKSIAFTVNKDGYSELKILRPEKGDAPSRIDLPQGAIIGDLDWSPDSSKLAFTLTSAVLNTDVWTLDLAKSAIQRITRVSTSGIEEGSFVHSELYKYKSFDNLEISSYLFLPKEPKKPSPLLIYLHGGPESQFRPGFDPLLQYFVNLGIAVGIPNFRGSTGYGRTFTHLDDVLNRMNTVRDVESFLSNLKARSDLGAQIDFGRVVAWGGSYGGFMVLGCLYSNPDVWAAGVDIVGIANFVTFLRNTGPWRRKIRIAEYGDPERDYEFLTKISPTTNADRIRAPLFVIHGNNDPRVPLEEAEQIVETMQKLGREVHLLKFESEGHGLHKIKDRIEGYSQAIDFLLEHIKG